MNYLEVWFEILSLRMLLAVLNYWFLNCGQRVWSMLHLWTLLFDTGKLCSPLHSSMFLSALPLGSPHPTTHTSSKQVTLSLPGVALGAMAHSRTALPMLGRLWESPEVFLNHTDTQVFPCRSGSELWDPSVELSAPRWSSWPSKLEKLCSWGIRKWDGTECSGGARLEEEEYHCRTWA